MRVKMGCSASTSVVPEVPVVPEVVSVLKKTVRLLEAGAVIIGAGISKFVLTVGLVPAYGFMNPFTLVFVACTVVGIPILLGCKWYIENYTKLYAGLVEWEAKQLKNLGFEYPDDDSEGYGPDL